MKILYNLKIFFLFILFQSNTLISQMPVCGNEFFYDCTTTLRFDRKINKYLKFQRNEISQRSDIYINIVFHIVYEKDVSNVTDKAILQEVRILNNAFNSKNADISKVPYEFKDAINNGGINFCIASINSDEGIKIGIERRKTEISQIGIKDNLYHTYKGGLTAWNTDKYLNIWIADTGNNIRGYGTYPRQVPKEKEGIVISPKYFGENNSRRYNMGKTLIHEIGHYLGLKHIWGDKIGCEFDDLVSDTPDQEHRYIGCPDYPVKSCNSNDMFMNYMDYVDDECMYMFTEGQMERMKATIMIYRKELIQNSMCENMVITPKNDFRVFPNPTSQYIIIDFDSSILEIGEIIILDNLGQKIYNVKTYIYNKKKIDVSFLSKGIYFIGIGKVYNKFIVK